MTQATLLDPALLAVLGKTTIRSGREYIAKHFIVAPRGLVSSPTSVVKVYTMFEKGKVTPYSEEQIIEVEDFIRATSQTREPYNTTGMGFAIISEGNLNHSMWGGDLPSAMNPRVYRLGGEMDSTMITRHVFINDVGPYCCWEGKGVVAHESNAWAVFLRSQRKPSDKQAYLDDFFEGEV